MRPRSPFRPQLRLVVVLFGRGSRRNHTSQPSVEGIPAPDGVGWCAGAALATLPALVAALNAAAGVLQAAAAVGRCPGRPWPPQKPQDPPQQGRSAQSGYCQLVCGYRLGYPSSTCGSFGCGRRFPIRHSSCRPFSRSAAAAAGATSARPECLIRLERIAVRLPPRIPFFSAAVVPSDSATNVIGAKAGLGRCLGRLRLQQEPHEPR
jgi:hypothetical protein